MMLIHVGVPKTGTTFLQTDIFPKARGIRYLGKLYNGDKYADSDLLELINSITSHDSINFKSEFQPTYFGYLESSQNGSVPLISDEAFTNGVIDRGVVCDRLAEFFPRSKILIVLREQFAALQSMYAFLVMERGKNLNKSFGRPSVASYDRWIEEQMEFPQRSYISQLLYANLVQKYIEKFGNKNVLVITYEEMKHSPTQFSKRLSEFIGVEITQELFDLNESGMRNKSPRGLNLKLRRLNNAINFVNVGSFLPRSVKSFLQMQIFNDTSSSFGLADEYRDYLKNKFAEDNQRLFEITNSKEMFLGFDYVSK